MQISPGEVIADMAKFLQSHERFIRHLKPGKARTAYETRLNRVKQLIIEKNEQANKI